jgi:hypothetical protein
MESNRPGAHAAISGLRLNVSLKALTASFNNSSNDVIFSAIFAAIEIDKLFKFCVTEKEKLFQLRMASKISFFLVQLILIVNNKSKMRRINFSVPRRLTENLLIP